MRATDIYYRRTKEKNRSVEKAIREGGWELPISHKWAGTWTKPSSQIEKRYLVGCACKKPSQLLSSCISLLWAVLWISIRKCPLSINERPNSVSMKEGSTKSAPTAYNTQLMLSYYRPFIKIQLFRLPILLSNSLCTSLSLFLTSHAYRVRRMGQIIVPGPKYKVFFLVFQKKKKKKDVRCIHRTCLCSHCAIF